MHLSYRELCETPLQVVHEHMAFMEVEGKVKKMKREQQEKQANANR